jgi:hypothetical protein
MPEKKPREEKEKEAEPRRERARPTDPREATIENLLAMYEPVPDRRKKPRDS